MSNEISSWDILNRLSMTFAEFLKELLHDIQNSYYLKAIIKIENMIEDLSEEKTIEEHLARVSYHE